MGRHAKLLERIPRGTSDADVPFASLRGLTQRLGFKLRINGSHHIFLSGRHCRVLNFQPKGAKAKPCQVKQTREIILKYK